MNSAILFDMDGTILDTEPLYTRAEVRLFAEYGVSIPKEDWSLYRGCSEEDFYTLSMKRYNIKEARNIFIKKGRNYVRKEFESGLNFMPGFHSMIKRIKQKHKIGLVTASPKKHVNWLCTIIGLDKIFNHIICGGSTEKNKPHPDPYIKMMKILSVEPKNTIIVEDSINGLLSAISSGAHVIAKTGSVNNEDLTIAHHIISSLNEINENLINELLQTPL